MTAGSGNSAAINSEYRWSFKALAGARSKIPNNIDTQENKVTKQVIWLDEEKHKQMVEIMDIDLTDSGEPTVRRTTEIKPENSRRMTNFETKVKAKEQATSMEVEQLNVLELAERPRGRRMSGKSSLQEGLRMAGNN